MERNGIIYVNNNTTEGEHLRFELDKRHGVRRDLEDAISFFRD